jgi:hypothetical protein
LLVADHANRADAGPVQAQRPADATLRGGEAAAEFGDNLAATGGDLLPISWSTRYGSLHSRLMN